MLTLCPFVVLAPDITAKELRELSPFLWLNIIAVTARTPGQQSTMSDHIKRFVAQKMVVDNDKSLDLFLGLLVFINWYIIWFILCNFDPLCGNTINQIDSQVSLSPKK